MVYPSPSKFPLNSFAYGAFTSMSSVSLKYFPLLLEGISAKSSAEVIRYGSSALPLPESACTAMAALWGASCGADVCSSPSGCSGCSGCSGVSGCADSSGVSGLSGLSGTSGVSGSTSSAAGVCAAPSAISASTEVGSRLVSIRTTRSHDATRFFMFSVSFMQIFVYAKNGGRSRQTPSALWKTTAAAASS